MGIQIATNIQVTAALPLDGRALVADLTALAAIPTAARYRGMRVTVAADLKSRVWDGSIWVIDGGSGQTTATGTFTGDGTDKAFAVQHNLGASLKALLVETEDGEEVHALKRRVSDNEHQVIGSFPDGSVYRWTALA